MTKVGNGSSVVREKSRKRPFRPGSVPLSLNLFKQFICLTPSGGDLASFSPTTGIPELEQILKHKTFTRSEAQRLIALVHSRTMEESPSSLLSLEASTTSGSIKIHKHGDGDKSDKFHDASFSSNVVEEEIAPPVEFAKTYKGGTIGQAPRQDLKMITKNATCLSKTPMASPQHPTTMENLPLELLSNIFIRLLAKQLAQMRSISKSWNTLLSESSFIRSHLDHSIHNKDQILLLFYCNSTSSNYKRFTALPYRSPHLELTNFIKLPPINPQSRFKGIRIIGSVNGLICSSYDDVIHIWNPSLSTVLTLPPFSMPSDGYNSIRTYFWFGFDPKTDDYKVMKFTGLIGEPYHHIIWWLDVEIYSMRKGSWKLTTERFPSHITRVYDDDWVCSDGHGGHLHWLACIGESFFHDRILAFDVSSETFREMPMPDPIIDYYKENRANVLGVLAGKLCVVSRLDDGSCEVWVMDEYGVAESWVKRHVISPFNYHTFPLGFTLHNELLLFDRSHNLVLYDPVANKTEIFKNSLPGKGGPDKIVEYVDSLVWVTPAKHEMVDDVGQC